MTGLPRPDAETGTGEISSDGRRHESGGKRGLAVRTRETSNKSGQTQT